MGRSRGGLTTKIHALVDAVGRPIRLKLTEGQAHDGRSAADMFATLGPGSVLLADRAYDSDALRARLAKQGAWGNIRLMPNRIRLQEFCPELYKERNFVERFFNKLNTSGQSQPDTTSVTTTSSPPCNWLHCGFGCDLMSR